MRVTESRFLQESMSFMRRCRLSKVERFDPSPQADKDRAKSAKFSDDEDETVRRLSTSVVLTELSPFQKGPVKSKSKSKHSKSKKDKDSSGKKPDKEVGSISMPGFDAS